MALDPVGASAILGVNQAQQTGSLRPEPQDQIRDVATQLDTAVQTNPVSAQAQAQTAFQSDQQNANTSRQDREAQERGERIDIEA